MIIRDIGIVGTGLWQGEVVENDRFQTASSSGQVTDPYRGSRGDDGTLRIAGMEFTPDKYPRTIAALDKSFRDPFRGTRRRRHFPHDLKSSDAEAEAATKALADAGIEPAQVGAVLVQSFLPDVIQPKNAALVAHKLGIKHAPAWEVDSICNSVITHIAVGSSLIQSGLASYVLCVQSSAYSRVSDPTSSSRMQEGDMASAFVLGASPGTSMACSFRTDGRLHAAIDLHWAPPAGAAARRWWEPSQERLTIGFDRELQVQVMSEIADYSRTVCNEAMQRGELRYGDLDLFIAHQPMAWNKAFMEDVLGLAEGTAYDTFEEYASINSCGLSASIHEARKTGRVKRGTKLLIFGPGAGYTYSAVACRW